jgi:hypothetical protein
MVPIAGLRSPAGLRTCEQLKHFHAVRYCQDTASDVCLVLVFKTKPATLAKCCPLLFHDSQKIRGIMKIAMINPQINPNFCGLFRNAGCKVLKTGNQVTGGSRTIKHLLPLAQDQKMPFGEVNICRSKERPALIFTWAASIPRPVNWAWAIVFGFYSNILRISKLNSYKGKPYHPIAPNHTIQRCAQSSQKKATFNYIHRHVGMDRGLVQMFSKKYGSIII